MFVQEKSWRFDCPILVNGLYSVLHQMDGYYGCAVDGYHKCLPFKKTAVVGG